MSDFGQIRSAVHENNTNAINQALESFDGSKEEARQALDYVLEIRGPGALLWGVWWEMRKDDRDVDHPIWLPNKLEHRRVAFYRVGDCQIEVAEYRLDLVQMWLCERMLPFLHLWCQDSEQHRLVDVLLESYFLNVTKTSYHVYAYESHSFETS